MSLLRDQCAFVTGASGGIGRATAIELARRGARVAVHYFRNKAGAEETAAAIAALPGSAGRAPIVSGDLSNVDGARQVVDAVEKELGRIDVLVNNAGDLVARRPLLEMDEAYWRTVMDTNVSSVLYVTQAAVPGMLKRKQGSIINLGSLAAWNGGGPGSLAYAAAKGAVVSLTKAIAKELATQGIRVNCVSPGLIDDTAFHGRFTPREAFNNIVKTIPMARAGRPDEVARVIAFLAAEDSSFLTGETIEINGGAFMR